MTKPRVSVLIDTHNHERYVEQAIVSVLEQDFPAGDMEVVVVDDGSTDRTPEIVRKFGPQVRLLTKKNGGQASAFNLAIPELRGEIVSFLDGDDWFAPGKLSAVMSALEEHPGVTAVGHGYYEFHEGTDEIRVCVPAKPQLLHLATPEAADEALHAWRFLLPSALAVRRRILDRIMPIPEVLVFCADTPIQIGSMAGGVLLLAQPLLYYRHHSANLRATGTESTARRRRGIEMNELAFELALPLLARLGVPSESARALIYPAWVHINREELATFGGSRLKALRTEMRSFLWSAQKPGFSYRLFKYFVVAPAALTLPPRLFYKVREWYARGKLRSIRKRLAKSSASERQLQTPIQ
jgi:glycosyltransferase involved in cell wall biosynthesis